MTDRYKSYIHHNIFNFKTITIDDEKYTRIVLSYDKFKTFFKEYENKTISNLLDIRIYDERIIKDINNFQSENAKKRILNEQELRLKLITILNNLPIRKITFILSDSTLPVYNYYMNTIAWNHKDKTTINMIIDRNPTSEKIRDLNLNKAMGTINMPEEKLIWIPDNHLNSLEGIIDKKALENTIKLKKLIFIFEDYIRTNYNIEELTDFDKVLLTYNFIKLNIRYATQYVETSYDKNFLKSNHPSYIKEPFGTWINKEGTSEGISRLMVILLNNPIIKVEATTLYGSTPQGMKTWLGIIINNKLYQCCPITNRQFDNLELYGYNILDSSAHRQLYPLVYENSYLSERQIRKITNKVRKLRR